MHLDSRQIILLIIPFFLSGSIYFFDMDIVQNVKYLFPSYQEYSNKRLDKKADIYLKILSKDKVYQDIQNRVTAREDSSQWIAQTILYKKLIDREKILYNNSSSSSNKRVVKAYSWKLQAVFNKKEVAIINSKIVKLGSFIDGGKLIRIKEDRVLIQYNKGLKKWLHLFQ